MAVICVDLSDYQAGFDFDAFKAGGGLGVICKATEGSWIEDQSYKAFRSAAKSAGVAFASYHFLRSGDMAKQASYYLDFAAPDQGERVVADYEDESVSLSDLVNFLKAVQAQRPDLQLTVYGSNVLEETLGSQTVDWLAQNTSLWTAAYSSSPGKYPTQVWPFYSLWQYTDSVSVPGFNGSVDGNKFNGSNDLFLKWMGPGAAPSPPVVTVPVITISSTQPVQIQLGANVSMAAMA